MDQIRRTEGAAGRALLVISFGTTRPGTREKTIGRIEKDLADAFPDRVFYRAWTSPHVRKKVEIKSGEKIPGVPEALDQMAADGVRDVLIQPTHLLGGIEHEEMMAGIRERAGRFQTLAVGEPLLASEEDLASLTAGLMQDFALPPEDALVWMGHGTEHRANAVYARAEEFLRRAGGERVFLGTVEGGTDLDALIGRVKAARPRRVYLAPFLIVAGAHAEEDMAGDAPDSWKNRFAAAGMEPVCVMKGLGEYPVVRRLFLEHARAAEEAAGPAAPQDES